MDERLLDESIILLLSFVAGLFGCALRILYVRCVRVFTIIHHNFDGDDDAICFGVRLVILIFCFQYICISRLASQFFIYKFGLIY